MWTRNEAILLGLQQMCREIGCDTAASISDGTVTHGRDAKEMSRRRSWARKGSVPSKRRGTACVR